MQANNKVAIVTGGGSGIGQAIVERLAQEKIQVIIGELNLESAQETAQRIKNSGGQALAIAADVTKKEDVEAMVAQTQETYGRIDILVNNVGLATGNDILDSDEESWDYDLDIVLKSVFRCSKAVLPSMMEQKQGSIVNIASVNGLAAFGHMAYSAAKAGIINVTKNMAVNYGQYNIRVNAVCPGSIRTAIWDSRLEIDPHLLERLVKWYPLKRIGEPEDIAKAVWFLASDDAAWITGQTLAVDGGLMAGHYRMARELEAKADELTD